MRYANIPFSILLIALLLSGCAAHNAADDMQKRMQEQARLRAAEPKYVAQYDVSLIEVQRPTDAQSRFGELKISPLDTSQGKVFHASDGLITVLWNGPGTQLVFDLLNNFEIPIKVMWDEAAYVDITGFTHRVIHNGVKLADRNSSQPPSVIPTQGRLNDIVYPSDLVSYSGSRYGWAQPPMFPCMPGMVCPEAQRQRTTAHTGLTYRVLLPIQVEKDTYPYTFVFRVSRADIMTIKGAEEERK